MDRTFLYEASMAWSPAFPRQATYGDGAKQHRVNSRVELIDSLCLSAKGKSPGYQSVYSFPRGHSKEESIPEIDTIFFDLDIPSGEGEYNPRSGGNTENWRRDMSKLLVRARMVAQAILDSGNENHWRVAYSGHKGIHLYIDFPSLGPDLGPLQQYKNGISNYADELVDILADEAGIEIHHWVDVDSHDLGRLSRMPNTPHHGAKHVDWTPYCVAGSVQELRKMKPDDYLRVTRNPRKLPEEARRDPSELAGEVLTEKIKEASDEKSAPKPGGSKHRDEDALDAYRNSSNENIDAETVENLLVKNKPCINAWVNRDDAYDHGNQSREMEINVIKELAKHEVPIDVMVEYFSDIPRNDEEYTRSLIKDVIARYHPSSFVCRNVVNGAPTFCLQNECHLYKRSDDLKVN